MNTEKNIVKTFILQAEEALASVGILKSHIGQQVLGIVEKAIKEAYLAGLQEKYEAKFPNQNLPAMTASQKAMFLFLSHLKATIYSAFVLTQPEHRSQIVHTKRRQFSIMVEMMDNVFGGFKIHPLVKPNAGYLDNNAALFLELGEQGFIAKNGAMMLAVLQCYHEGMVTMEGSETPLDEVKDLKELAA